MAVGIVCANEPFTVPTVFEYSVIHCGDLCSCTLCFCIIAKQFGKLCIFLAIFYEHAGDKYGLGNRSLTWTEGLEGFARMLREAVEVQTVIPVSTSDQGQIVWSLVVYDIVEGAFQMLHQCRCHAHIIVVRHHLFQDTKVSCLADISTRTCNQP